MRIPKIITSNRTGRAKRPTLSVAVSFKDFCNDAERYPTLKESSLNESLDISPVKVRDNKRFSRQTEEIKYVSSSRPSLVTVLLFTVLSAVLLESNAMHNVINPSEKHDISKYLPTPPAPDYGQCKLLKDADKFDCFPGDGANQGGCEARGCCWIPAKSKPKKLKRLEPNVPYCFYPPNYNTYKFLNVTERAFGLEAFLKRTYRTAYPDDMEFIKMIVKYETKDRLHVKFVDPKNFRYEPSYPKLPVVNRAAQNLNYIFELDTLRPGFKVVRKADNTTLFDANNFLDFTFSNQFLQISTRLPSKYVYGIGEQVSSMLLNTQWSRFTMWNHDTDPTANNNLYGTQPFYLSMENSSNSHGVFLLNSNAMEVLLQPSPALTFRTIGGVLDLFFFMGPTPSDVIDQYTDLIGRPYMPPYWGLGYHLCRYGYKSLNQTIEIMENNLRAGIFIDTQWNDLDYMINNNDFTYDKELYKGLPEFVDNLHKRGMHYIPIVDPGISAGEPIGSYPPYDIGIAMDIFVKNASGKPFVGKVWNSHSTVWPDFTNPKTVAYWTLMLKNYHREVPFDGVWIDMNEPSNFVNGSIDGCPESNLENPPYLPAVEGGALNYKTMCMTAKHYAGTHYDVHNLYGLTESIITSLAMTKIRRKRPMVIGRSSFSGLGHYTGHWSGDVYSTWDDLKLSIPQLLSFSLFGVPLMGADICGFNGNTTAALCNRWHQLGAFYPFARNHNTDDGIPQDPFSMGQLVVTSTKKALEVRYALLPYLYTLFYKAHVSGDTVARPLFFEFYTDKETYGIDTEFLWGSGLLIVPVLQEGATSVMAYLPEGIWYDYYTKYYIESKGEYFNLTAPLDTIPVLVRGGSVLPQQDAKPTTTESRKTKIKLLVAPEESGKAWGELFWDDGDSLNTIKENRYSLISFNLENGTLRSENANWKAEFPPNLGSVTVLGVQKPVSEVTVNNLLHAFKFDTVHKYLIVDNLDISFEKPMVMSWK